MSAVRFICLLVGWLLPVVAHSEQMIDTFPLYKAICLASNGNLEQAAALATAHGFTADPEGSPIKIYRRSEQSGSSLPSVVLKQANPMTDGLDICEVVGKSRFLSSFLEEARGDSMIEIPKEAVLGSVANDIEANYFIRRDCNAFAMADGCFMMSAVGSAVVNDTFDGVYRFSIVPGAKV